MTGTDRAIRYRTVAAVAGAALVDASVSYRHALEVVGQHGETGWLDGVYPLTVEGLIYASSCCSTKPDAACDRIGWPTPLSVSASRQPWP